MHFTALPRKYCLYRPAPLGLQACGTCDHMVNGIELGVSTQATTADMSAIYYVVYDAF